MTTCELLEDWLNQQKGRYVEIEHGNDYAACCWTVTIGNTDIIPKDNWFVEDGDIPRAIIIVEEVAFFDGDLYPNCFFVSDGEGLDVFPGLEKTILFAIEKANELGL